MDNTFFNQTNKSSSDQSFSFKDVCYFRNDLKFFSEPENLTELKKAVLPKLGAKSELKVWLPFSETGEDAYTLSILFYEHKFHQNFQILAGEDNENKLIQSLQGKYHKDDILRARRTYFFSGGKSDLMDYFIFEGDDATIRSDIRNQVIFSKNDKIDPSDSDLIYLPNLLSKMEVGAQKQLVTFLKNNLAVDGFLVLGTYDSLSFSESFDGLEKIDEDLNIWRKMF